MTTVNEINQIYCNESINVKQINMTSLLFVDNKVVSKSRYSVVDDFINLLDPAENTICLYQHKGSSNYYEYQVNLKNSGTILSGTDINGNTLTLSKKERKEDAKNNIMVFVDGYKLLPSQFDINLQNNSVEILNSFIEKEKYTVIIYISNSLVYLGNVENDETWKLDEHSFTLDDYTYLRYLFFKNGEIITRDSINKIYDTVTINVNFRPGIDTIEYYRLPIDTENVLFFADPGYFSYGPKDSSGLPIPEIHDAEVTFQSIVRLAIDDVRKGFFIREKDGDGCLMITGEDFETRTAYCTTIVPFSKDSYDKESYFVQVPNARSILKYISEYDLKRMLMPEILGGFQKLLLDETYDSVQRLKNIRSINKVDSSQIGQLINFMGLNINLTNLDLAKKHALLEELTNFYKIVGTRESYNFYNTTTTNGKIISMQQLFTPIRDVNSGNDPVKRYVDFRTAEELGATTHKRYEYPHHDLGYVDELADATDSFTNQPRYEGVRPNMTIPAVTSDKRSTVYVMGKVNPDNPSDILNSKNKVIGHIDPDNNVIDLHGNIIGVVNGLSDLIVDDLLYKLVSVREEITVPLNDYTIQPITGPNKGQLNFGSVSEDATSFYDFGLVSEIIKGKWVEWTTWDRPTNWYPTNHVDVEVQVPPNVEYETFMTEFKNTFYNIASTVLYIHSIVEVYTFGKDNPFNTASDDEATGGGANFDILTTPIYYTLEYTFTNDPARQDYRG